MQGIWNSLDARHDREDGGAHRGLGKANAQLRAEGRRPGAAGHHHLTGLDHALFGNHPGYPARLGFDTAGSAELMDRPAMLEHSLGDQRRRPRRVGDAIGRREYAAQPGLAGGRAALRGLGTAQHMGGDALGDGEVAPLGPAIELGLVVRQIEQSAATEAEVLA
ncbi:hypothetical protein D3C76_843320 [compost metagenome]